MNLEEIKGQLGLSQLFLNEDKNEKDEPTGWYSMWIDATRTKIIIPADAVMAIKEGNNPNLGLKPEIAKVAQTGEKKPYVLKTIVMYSSADAVL